MLMNPTETSAPAVRPHRFAPAVLWLLKGSLVSPPPPHTHTHHSVHPQLSEVLAAQTGSHAASLSAFRSTLPTPRCSEQGFYVLDDGFSIRGCYTVSLLIKNEWRQAHCTDNYAYTPRNSWPGVMVTTVGHLRDTCSEIQLNRTNAEQQVLSIQNYNNNYYNS